MALLAATMIAAGFAFLTIRASLSGESLRDMLEDHGGRALGSRVELAPLAWKGSAVSSDRLRLAARSDSPLKHLEATSLRATWDWQAVFSGTWKLDECTIDSLTASFHREPTQAAVAMESTPPPWFAAFLPARVELPALRIHRADLDVDGLALKGSTLTIRQNAGVWMIMATGGVVTPPVGPALDVDFLNGRWQTTGFSLLDSSLLAGTAGRLRVRGDWPGSINLEGSHLPLRDFLDARWRDSVTGTLSGNATIAADSASGRVEISAGRLRGLPWLRELATLTGRSEFGDLPFSIATGNFEMREGVWHWRNLVLESTGLLRIEGDATLSPGGGLSGKLRVGVTERVLESLPGSRQFLFTESNNGYLCTPVVLGGTLDAPTEDLSPRLAEALGGALIESVQPLLDTVPTKTRDTVGDTLDTLLDFLRP
jgi:hypothetical protein